MDNINEAIEKLAGYLSNQSDAHPSVHFAFGIMVGVIEALKHPHENKTVATPPPQEPVTEQPTDRKMFYWPEASIMAFAPTADDARKAVKSLLPDAHELVNTPLSDQGGVVVLPVQLAPIEVPLTQLTKEES